MDLAKQELTIEDKDKIRAFVGKKYDVYFRKWGFINGEVSLSNPHSKISWNWASCLLGAFWMGYRKMYAEGMIYTVILMTISSLLRVADKFTLLDIVSAIILGLIGNHLYFHKMKRDLAKLENDNIDTISKAGGTSKMGAFAMLMFSGFLGMVFGDIFNW